MCVDQGAIFIAGLGVCPPWRYLPVFVLFFEETLDFEIQWNAKGPKHRIQNGQALGGFAIEVSTQGADDSYRNSFFDVTFAGGRYLHISTHITADTPPTPGTAVPLQNCVDPYAVMKTKDGDELDNDEESGDNGKNKHKDKK